MNEIGTKDRILDAAERLFALHGIDATSLRAITAEADVNLAAVNYHFQSKEALVGAVLARRLEPTNRRRLEMLDAFEAEAGTGPVPIPRLLEAFLRPVIEMKNSCAKHFMPMMGRLYSEQRESVAQIFKVHFGEIVRRFHAAFQRSLPHLAPSEVTWRMHFLIGGMVHTLGAQHILRPMLGEMSEIDDVERTVVRMIGFFTAAFEAPVAEVQHAH